MPQAMVRRILGQVSMEPLSMEPVSMGQEVPGLGILVPEVLELETSKLSILVPELRIRRSDRSI